MEAQGALKDHGCQSVISICPVVGIGASAGGLEALKALLSHLPSTTGMAYVVVQHLDPSYPSLLPGLLAHATALPIREVVEGVAVEPDRVYICPPNAELTLIQSTFHLSSPSSNRQMRGRPDVIDRFLTSLSHAQGRQVVGVLLSGTGSDGTVGVQTIRAAGGITFAQNPASAQFPQMPQSAIEAGGVDHVLSCEQIAHALAQIGSHTPLSHVQPTPMMGENAAAEPGFTSILRWLSSQSSVDFRSYKPATLQRRIESRMALLHLAHLSSYAAYLREHPEEVEALAQSVLIAVTDFFRDPAAFEALTRLVWPTLLSQHDGREPLRIWVPGCSTGEEAYSLAISLLEFLQAHELEQPFQLFASDVNPKAIAQARTGIYAASSLAPVGAERIRRFFTPVDRQRSRYRIDASLRERCAFAQHNLLHDPPFTHLDLISCRNVLIYLQASVQQQIVQTLHYALVPEGFLLLGTSESIEPLARLFGRVETSLHLYRKQAIGGILLPPGTNQGQLASAPPHKEGDPMMTEERSLGGDILQEADHLRLTHYVLASVVVDAQQEIVQVRGQTSPYLELAGGHATLNLLKMARPGLSLGLRTALRSARKEHRTVIREGVHVSAFGTTRSVRLTVIPLKGPPTDEYCLVLFEEQASLPDARSAPSEASEPASHRDRRERKEKRITKLEQELSTQEVEMQIVLEEHDAESLVLQSANEEIQASNEELRSLNEELQTSKEELQTINEELATTNQELVTRNEQLKAAQEYADAIVETTRSPLVVLSQELRVERANVAFYLFFQTTPPETEGRLLFELGHGQWDIPRLRTLLHEIRPIKHALHDFEVNQVFPRIGRKALLLNARHLLLDHEPVKEHRMLLAMEDITERRAAEREMQARLTFLQQLLNALPNSVYLVQGQDARLVLANRAAATLWGAEWPIGQPMLDFLKSRQIRVFDPRGEVLSPAALATLRALTPGTSILQQQETIVHADGTTLPVLVNAVAIEGQELLSGSEAAGDSSNLAAVPPAALVIHQDVTSLKQAEELKDRFLGLVAHELRTPLAAVKGFTSMLLIQTARGKGPPLAEWQQEVISEINIGSDRLTRLTNDLLDVVRLHAGRMVLHHVSLDLVNLTQRVIAALQRTTDRHQLTLSLIPPSLSKLMVQVDEDRIEQVLSNLLSNAIKYSPQGGEIEVIVRKEEEQETVLISIRDQGIGIPQAEQARLFGRFVRASNGEAQGINGTGLGLYLCRELVEQHGGRLWFESTEGVGSTFFMMLPLSPDVSARPERRAAPREVASTEPVSGL
ncbi:MAG TPA: chemotaxis protein CheB [Ktedonobacteraceae bacterium]